MVAPAKRSSGSQIARNFSVMLSSQFTTFALSILATVVIPRYLGAAIIGRLQLATALWAMGGAIVGFGMDLAITKAVARDHSVIGEIAATAAVARLLLMAPVTCVVFLYALGAGYSPQVIGLLAILAVGALALALGTITDSILLGVERVGAMSIAAIVGRVVGVAGAVVLLALGYGVYAVAVVGVAGVALTTALQVRTTVGVWRELDGVRPPRPTQRSITALLAECAPYFWITFFMIAYQQIDTIVISLLVANDDVLGWYSVYDRLAGMLMFAPVVFMSVLYPTLSRMFSADHADEDQASSQAPTPVISAEHKLVTQRTFRLMVMVSMPAGVGLAVLAQPLIELLYGDEFAEAAPVVAVGAIVVSLTYLTTVFSMILISMDRQRPLTVLLALSATLTIPLDIALVPFFESRIGNGAVGGVVAYAITETIMLGGTIFLLPRGSLGRPSLLFALRVAACSAVMALAIYPLRQLNLVIPIATGVAVFAVGAAVFRLVDADDRRALASALPDRLRTRPLSES